ncbi:hypothetical protein CC80DRAFT_498689 [Byssothecium circinans]|uniref:Uncharacterized protein n=1 Tax=Byssothecium circinans TaxID=147558 RepID=A0A6A5UIB0_9PLEO|nr:hypothetical protein CC80DRAFT_498689 [Byssothecium circinans]
MSAFWDLGYRPDNTRAAGAAGPAGPATDPSTFDYEKDVQYEVLEHSTKLWVTIRHPICPNCGDNLLHRGNDVQRAFGTVNDTTFTIKKTFGFHDPNPPNPNQISVNKNYGSPSEIYKDLEFNEELLQKIKSSPYPPKASLYIRFHKNVNGDEGGPPGSRDSWVIVKSAAELLRLKQSHDRIIAVPGKGGSGKKILIIWKFPPYIHGPATQSAEAGNPSTGDAPQRAETSRSTLAPAAPSTPVIPSDGFIHGPPAFTWLFPPKTPVPDKDLKEWNAMLIFNGGKAIRNDNHPNWKGQTGRPLPLSWSVCLSCRYPGCWPFKYEPRNQPREYWIHASNPFCTHGCGENLLLRENAVYRTQGAPSRAKHFVVHKTFGWHNPNPPFPTEVQIDKDFGFPFDLYRDLEWKDELFQTISSDPRFKNKTKPWANTEGAPERYENWFNARKAAGQGGKIKELVDIAGNATKVLAVGGSGAKLSIIWIFGLKIATPAGQRPAPGSDRESPPLKRARGEDNESELDEDPPSTGNTPPRRDSSRSAPAPSAAGQSGGSARVSGAPACRNPRYSRDLWNPTVNRAIIPPGYPPNIDGNEDSDKENVDPNAPPSKKKNPLGIKTKDSSKTDTNDPKRSDTLLSAKAKGKQPADSSTAAEGSMSIPFRSKDSDPNKSSTKSKDDTGISNALDLVAKTRNANPRSSSRRSSNAGSPTVRSASNSPSPAVRRGTGMPSTVSSARSPSVGLSRNNTGSSAAAGAVSGPARAARLKDEKETKAKDKKIEEDRRKEEKKKEDGRRREEKKEEEDKRKAEKDKAAAKKKKDDEKKGGKKKR